MTLPMYDRDPGFKYDPDRGQDYIVIDHSKVGEELLVETLLANIEQEYEKLKNRKVEVVDVMLCLSPHGDEVLVIYVGDTVMH